MDNITVGVTVDRFLSFTQASTFGGEGVLRPVFSLQELIYGHTLESLS
jgi:hypothetical protein